MLINFSITDSEIARIFSNEESMILAAENNQCDVINNYMADLQHGETNVYEAK